MNNKWDKSVCFFSVFCFSRKFFFFVSASQQIRSRCDWCRIQFVLPVAVVGVRVPLMSVFGSIVGGNWWLRRMSLSYFRITIFFSTFLVRFPCRERQINRNENHFSYFRLSFANEWIDKMKWKRQKKAEKKNQNVELSIRRFRLLFKILNTLHLFPFIDLKCKFAVDVAVVDKRNRIRVNEWRLLMAPNSSRNGWRRWRQCQRSKWKWNSIEANKMFWHFDKIQSVRDAKTNWKHFQFRLYFSLRFSVFRFYFGELLQLMRQILELNSS